VLRSNQVGQAPAAASSLNAQSDRCTGNEHDDRQPQRHDAIMPCAAICHDDETIRNCRDLRGD
jgi:hypothetical protein